MVVGPQAIPLDHPAASLEGSSALVAITSDRYPVAPLVVRGAGAGGPVTATAVLSDVFLSLQSTPDNREVRSCAPGRSFA